MNIYKFILVCLFGILFSCKESTPKQMGIIPQPTFITYQEGSFKITNKTAIVTDATEEGQKLANMLVAFLHDNFNLNLSISNQIQDNAIQLIVSGENNKEGSYTLDASSKGVLVKAASYQGVFYGIQTLQQLLTPNISIKKPVISYLHINDEPEFKWRGMMLDVSRHFFPKDSVKNIIDILAMHKMNKLHWHLVDGIGWRIEIDKYPELTKRGAWRVVKKDKKPWEDFESCYSNNEGEVYGGFYTKEDIKEIVSYAADRYIDVIPEIEMPGHSEVALQCYPEFSCDGVESSGVYCAGNDGTFEFLQNIITEVVALFPGEYIHVGGDEVGKETWLQCKHCKKRMQEEKLQNGEELQSYFIKRMETFIHSKNKKLIGWDEILEGGLPERATVMSWRGVTGGIEAANAGHDVVMSPGSPCYFDHSQGKSEFEPPSWGGYNNLLKVYEFNPIPQDIASNKQHHILGGQANLWTEQIKTLSHVQYMMLPRICALSEALWTSSDQKSKEEFIKKMDFHFDRLQELGYNFAGSSLSPEYEVTYDKVAKHFSLSLKNELKLYEIRYTLDGSIPNQKSELYKNPIIYTAPIQIYAQCFRKGIPIGFPLSKLFSTGFGEKCKVTYTNAYNESYSGGGEMALFDSNFAISRGDDANWQGIPQKDFEVLIDLGETNELSYVGLNFFQHIGATSVMLPTQVNISVSKDGINFSPILEQSIETVEQRDPIIRRIEIDFQKQQVAFIKITAKNRATLPDWHIRSGDAWLFVDEVSIK